MRPIPIFSLAALLLVGVLTPWSVAAQKPSARYDKNMDFSGFETYSWQKRPADSADALAEGEPLDLAIRAGADAALARNGLERVESGGQLTLNYHGGIVSGISADRRRGWAGKDTAFEGSSTSMHDTAYTIPMGTIVLEVIEPESDELVWAGTGQFKIKSFEAPSDSPQIRSKAKKLAGQIAKQFPPD